MVKVTIVRDFPSENVTNSIWLTKFWRYKSPLGLPLINSSLSSKLRARLLSWVQATNLLVEAN